MTDAEREEWYALRREMYLCSLGDRPPSMAADKLRRLMELDQIYEESVDNLGNDDTLAVAGDLRTRRT